MRFIALFFLLLASCASAAASNHALLIGISRYDPKTSATPLPGVPHDLESAARIAGALGVPRANIRVLSDSAATKTAIVNELQHLTARVSEGGRAMIYFSGHGTRWFDPTAKGCVEGLYTYEGQVIVNREFAELAKKLGDKADKLIIMFDACHSEGVTSTGRTRSVSGDLSPKFFVRANDSPESCSRPANQRTRSLFNESRLIGIHAENIIHISSSRPDEVSFDEPGRGGLATQAVRDCMFGEARDLDRSGGITLNEIEACARGKIRLRLENHPALLPHHPTIIGQRNLLAFNQQRQAEERVTREREDARLAAENQRREQERITREQERLRLERLARESQDREQAEREQARLKLEQERLAAERGETERREELRRQELARQRAEELRREQDLLAQAARLEREQQQAAERESERRRVEAAKREQERIESERRQAERLAQQRAREEAQARDEAEKKRLAEERSRQEAEAERLAQLAREQAERTPQSTQQEEPPAATPLGPVATLQNILDQRDSRRQLQVRLQKARLKIEADELAMTVTSQRDGYLYLIHIEPDLQTFTLLFPNGFQSDNRVRAKQPVNLPRLDWRLVSAGPAGTSRVLAIVSDTPRDTKVIPPVQSSTPFSQVVTDMTGRSRLIDFAVGSGGAFGATIVEVEEYR